MAVYIGIIVIVMITIFGIAIASRRDVRLSMEGTFEGRRPRIRAEFETFSGEDMTGH